MNIAVGNIAVGNISSSIYDMHTLTSFLIQALFSSSSSVITSCFTMSSNSSSSSSSSSSESNELSVEDMLNMNMAFFTELYCNPVVHPTSSEQSRRRATIDRGRVDGHNRLYRDYFGDQPVYNDRQFRGRFRMSRQLFLRIVDSLSTRYAYFQQRSDITGRVGLSPLQKCTAAMRMIAYGVSADAVDDYVRLGKTTAQDCLNNFVHCVEEVFGEEYLRTPNAEDLQRLLSVGASRGFPGMLGSIDCMHWEWKNCPSAWKGQFARGDHGSPTIVLEAVASYDTWIWHAFFGVPGTCNDINVLDRSPLFDDILEDRAPPVQFTVNGNEYDLGYYLADGIYPPFATFVQSIRLPQSAKAQLFATRQESARKDVERAFGILQSRFAIIKCQSRMHHVHQIGKIMKACIIMHNMIVEDEGHTYATQYEFEDIGHGSTQWEFTPGATASMVRHIQNRARLRDRTRHNRLKHDLMEHIWTKEGNLP